MKKISNLLMMALLTIGMGLTSCDEQLDNAVTPYTPGLTPTVEEAIMYGFKVTDLAGVDRTEVVTSLKMSNEDGSQVVEAEVSADHKITIKNTALTAASFTAAADYWFEAEIGGKPYVAKVYIDPTALSPETDKTLEMATLGDVILSDGKFGVAEATGAVAKICYLGSETAEAAYGFNHGLALALSDASTGCNWKTEQTDAGHTKQTSSTFTEESGLQYNATHNSDTYPAFKAAINYNGAVAPTGCSAWFLASGYQWKKMIDAAGLSNLGLQESANYWSSTESGAFYAWLFDSSYGGWGNAYKNDVSRVRACLAF